MLSVTIEYVSHLWTTDIIPSLFSTAIYRKENSGLIERTQYLKSEVLGLVPNTVTCWL